MRKSIITILLISILAGVNAQSNWKFIEETNLQDAFGNMMISGVISKGYMFKTLSGKYYIADVLTLQVVVAVFPNVKIYKKDSSFKLIIEDFDEPVICKEIESVITTQISGEFNGWEGETLFKFLNGQIWQQSKYEYLYHYAYNPNILIYKFNNVWNMRVESVDNTIQVIKIK